MLIISSAVCKTAPAGMQDYYKRKVEEGKSKMSVLNAIANKIVARMCAVIENNKPYENYLLLS
ncbi:MAG: hypothetical protein ACOVSR_10080 [Bacteroidia bacterium]